MTSAQYRKAWDRLYIRSMRANSEAESNAIQRQLDKLNADYNATPKVSR
jgi:hypothetical protein